MLICIILAYLIGIFHCQYYSCNYLFFIIYRFFLVLRHPKQSKLGHMEAFITRLLLQKLSRSMSYPLLDLTAEKIGWCFNIPSEWMSQVSILCPFLPHPHYTAAIRTSPVTTGIRFFWESISGTSLLFNCKLLRLKQESSCDFHSLH